DSVAPAGSAPHVIRQTPRVKVRIDRHVVSEALRCGEERLELDLLHRLLGYAPALRVTNRGQYLVVCKERELLSDFRFLLQKGQIARCVDDLQVLPQLLDSRLHRGSAIGKRQHAHDLWEVRIRRGANQQPTRLVAWLVRVPAKPRPGA